MRRMRNRSNERRGRDRVFQNEVMISGSKCGFYPNMP
jgi:hypothetical protein